MLDFGYYNMDCIQGMKEFPDKYFDLAIVDPPYGINVDKIHYNKAKTNKIYGTSKSYKKLYDKSDWDSEPPSDEYFNELFRVSKKQVIWGGNYFKQLPPSRSFIVWDKHIYGCVYFPDCELAWCSNDMGVARIFSYRWNGFMQGDMKQKEDRIHVTQKPIPLYTWILTNYAEKGYKILDTHVGSASSLIACHRLGFEYVGFEIDENMYNKSNNRLENEKAQIMMEF